METARQKIVNRAAVPQPAAASWVALPQGRTVRGTAPVAAAFAGAMQPPARTTAMMLTRPDLRAPSLERFGVIGNKASAQHFLQRTPSEVPPPWTVGHSADRVPPKTPAGAARPEAAGKSAIVPTAQETPPPRHEQAPGDDRWVERSMPPSPAERTATPTEPAGPTRMPEPAPSEIPDNLSGPTSQTPEAEPRVESAPQTAIPQSDLLGNPQIPISGEASASLERIDTHAHKSHLLVSVQAKAKRGLIKLFVGGHRQLLSAFISNRILAVTNFFGRQQTRAVSWLLLRAAAVRGFVLGLITRATAMGTTISARIMGGIARLTAGVANGVNTVLARVIDTARSLPIPNIPGLGRVRTAVLNAAGRIAGVVRRALGNVQHFITRVIGSVIAAVMSLINRAGAALANILARLIAVVTRVVLLLLQAMRTLKNWIIARMRRLAGRVVALLARIESMVVARLDRAKAQAHAAIAANRRHGRATILHILDFCYAQGDHPADETVNGPLEQVDTTSSKETFESSARRALQLASAQIILRNIEIVQRFQEDTDSLITLTKGAITDFLSDIRRRAVQVVQEMVGHVTGAVSQLINHVATVTAQIIAGLHALIERLQAVLDRVVMVVTEVVRVPLNALTSIARTVIDAVRSFLQRIISRLVDLLRSIAGGKGEPDTDSSVLTSGFAAFDPARLAAAARMASPPAAAALVLVGGGLVIGEATVALILTILMWVAIVGIILLLLYALIMAVRWYMARPRALPRTRPIARPRIPARRRRAPRGLLRWNPSLVYGAVVASGGMPGTLDTTGPLPVRAPLHGHHVWPKFVGGPPVQPLLSIRGTVHISVVHPSLNVLLQGTARAMGHPISTHTSDPRNLAFVTLLRRDLGRRAAFSGVMAGYYAGLNAVTRPTIPAAAYLRGIVHSFPRI